MENEFNLSEKEDIIDITYDREDVKEFIKLLRKEICCCEFVKPKLCNNCYAINNLAGNDLI